MTTPITSSQPEKAAAMPQSTRTRSPGYPAFSLQTSLDRAKAVWQHEKRNPAQMVALATAWGLKVKSSSTLLTVSSLKKFGLLEEVDSGKERLLKLTEVALHIILNDQEDSPERIGMLKQCALLPVIHAELWEKYNGDLPSDTNLKRHLIMEKDFNASSVDSFIKQFRETISFAKLSPSDKITVVAPNEEMEEHKKPLLQQKHVIEGIKGMTAPGTLLGDFLNPQPKSVLREFMVPLSVGTIALRLPYPMEEDDFQLFLDTLSLWKKQLVKKPAGKTSEEVIRDLKEKEKSLVEPR